MQIGSFAVQTSLLLFVLTIAVSLAVNYYLLRTHPERVEITDRVFWASIVGVLLWKLSYFVIHPRETIADPISLLYFDGGDAGIWLGSIVFLAIIGWNAWKHRHSYKEYIGSGAVVIVTGMLVFGFLTASESLSIRAGTYAPELELQSRDGEIVKLSDYRGKTVLLNFWASWCPPCKAEMPHLQELHEKLAAEGDAAVLTVNLTSTEKSGQDVFRFLQKGGYTFPVLLDSEHDAAAAYGVRVYPTTYVIDSSGYIRLTIPGAMTLEKMEDAVRSVKQPDRN